MATRATIILDTGAFLTEEDAPEYFLDVGYFTTTFTSDMEIYVDGRKVAHPDVKLGTGNCRIDVEHLNEERQRCEGVAESPFFRIDTLSTGELYEDNEGPQFNPIAYDFILRFHSGTFESADVRARIFYEHSLTDDTRILGKRKYTRAIANDIVVQYVIGEGEELRLRSGDGLVLWTSTALPADTERVEVKLLSDDLREDAYFKKALNLMSPYYYLPNPDAPPAKGGVLAGNPLSPARLYECPKCHLEKYVAFYNPFRPPTCTNPEHAGVVLELKP